MEVFKSHPSYKNVESICLTLQKNGFTAWLAGGCVRDGLLSVLPKDFDVATDAEPEKVESLFKKTVAVGKAFGVIRVVFDQDDIEVATFRKDGAYIDGRRPVNVTKATPQEDAQRRDFTINAMFYDLENREVKDYVGGLSDLKDRKIKTVGVPERRFTEDKLRIMRAVRFVAQLDFNLEETTLKAVRAMAGDIKSVSWERINDEMTKLFLGLRPDRGMGLLHETGILKNILPEISSSNSLSNSFSKMVECDDRVLMGWVLLLVAISREQKDKIYKRFRLSNSFKISLEELIELIESLKIFDSLPLHKKKIDIAHSLVVLAFQYLEQIGINVEKLKEFRNKFPQLPNAFVGSKELSELGVKPGKLMGDLLEKTFNAQLDDKFSDKNGAIEWVKQNLK